MDDDFHGDLLGIMKEKSPDIEKVYPEGSFKRLYWEEQLRAASKKDPRQVRWHPLIIRWCLKPQVDVQFSISCYTNCRIHFPSI